MTHNVEVGKESHCFSFQVTFPFEEMISEGQPAFSSDTHTWGKGHIEGIHGMKFTYCLIYFVIIPGDVFNCPRSPCTGGGQGVNLDFLISTLLYSRVHYRSPGSLQIPPPRSFHLEQVSHKTAGGNYTKVKMENYQDVSLRLEKLLFRV